jgi:hypothetical protein
MKTQDDSWNGLIGMVSKEEIDVISTDILMEKERLDIVNFMDPLFEVRCCSIEWQKPHF